MKFTKFSVLIVGSLLFAGCSLLNKQGESISPSEVMDDSSQEESMMEDDSMMKDDAMMDDDAMMEDDGAMMDDSMMEEGHKVVELSATNFSFGVEEIEVNVGDKLTLRITNDEGFHDLLIDELGVDTGNIPEGDTVDVVVPTDQAGSFEYYCSVGNHRAQGMKGTLIIN